MPQDARCKGEKTTTLVNRRERSPQITPCTSLAPDFPISPVKMRPSFYLTAWFRGKLPGRSVRRPQSFADSLLRFGHAGRQLTVSLNRNSEQYPKKGPRTSTAKGGDDPPEILDLAVRLLDQPLPLLTQERN